MQHACDHKFCIRHFWKHSNGTIRKKKKLKKKYGWLNGWLHDCRNSKRFFQAFAEPSPKGPPAWVQCPHAKHVAGFVEYVHVQAPGESLYLKIQNYKEFFMTPNAQTHKVNCAQMQKLGLSGIHANDSLSFRWRLPWRLPQVLISCCWGVPLAGTSCLETSQETPASEQGKPKRLRYLVGLTHHLFCQGFRYLVGGTKNFGPQWAAE